jgi:subfamily B ATP-binding cassette protein MsbA
MAMNGGGLLRPHLGRVLAGLLLLLLLAVANAGYAYLTGPALRLVLSGGREGGQMLFFALPRWLAPDGALTALLGIALLIGALALVKGLANLGQALLLDGAAEAIGHRLRVRLYAHLLRLPLQHHRRLGLGDLLSRLLDDVQRVQEAAVAAPISLARETLGALALLGVALWMSPRLTLVAALALPVAALVIALLGKGVKRASTGRQQQVGALADRAAQALTAIREVKSGGAEQREIEGLAGRGRMALRWALRRIAIRAVAPLVNELMAAAALGATLVYAGGQIAAGALAPERFVSFFAAVLLMYRPVKEIGRALHVMATGRASVDRIQVLLDEDAERPASEALPPLQRGLELGGVGFTYDGEGGVAGVDLTLAVGELVALAGPSGAGKTTVANLVCGLERPSSGELRWDGLSLAARPLAELRARVALVPQQPLVLVGSLAENLRYAAPQATDAELRQAVEAVGLDELVRRLDRGLDTPLGPPEGLGLSVGEGQRLAIARALLRRVRLLVLDEPASALDPDNVARLARILGDLRRDHAILVVAHSPALLELADRVVWMRQGRVERVPLFEGGQCTPSVRKAEA